MSLIIIKQQSHRRFNPLTGSWVLVSPHRSNRPWQGSIEDAFVPPMDTYDATCYLCPGNARYAGVINPDYQNTFVFDNDFAALHPNVTESRLNIDNLLIAESEEGVCRVCCFTPRHDLTLARMSLAEIDRVVNVWLEQFTELGNLPNINSVLIFENRGQMMGASNPHPHCQIWANASLPNEMALELHHARAYFSDNGRTLLGDYLDIELRLDERVVCQNEHFAAIVPFWAVYPFETLVVSRRPVTGFDEMNRAEIVALSRILKELAMLYDGLFDAPFPYSMGFHQRPTDGADHRYYHFHAHFYPPLLRSANIRKFMVGYELLAMPQRDLTPEEAAAKLRETVFADCVELSSGQVQESGRSYSPDESQ